MYVIDSKVELFVLYVNIYIMKKTILGTFIVSMLMVSMTAITTPQAEAACSYNGYTNSSGKCSNSYTNYRYSTNNTFQYNQIAGLEAQILQLLAMLEKLQNLQAQVGYTNTGGNSDVDIITRSARDISDEEATFRGEIDFNNEDEATVYFQYGKSSTNLRYDTTHFVLDEDDDNETFEHTITGLDEDTRYYYRAVGEDENDDRNFGNILTFTTDDNGRRSSNDDEPELQISTAQNVDEDSADLQGSVDMNDFRNGLVFFVYGEDEDLVDDISKDYDEYADIDEDGDDLQKVKVDSDHDGDENYDYTVRNLNEDEDIYFSICVEYEDDDDDQVIDCSSVRSFSTDDSSSSNDDEPDITTVGYSNVTDDSARMRGSVDMNDFDNGIAFIVYGEDEDQVEDVADDYDTYSDIDEDGDDLQKIKVRSNVDTTLSFYAYTSGLDNNTDIYFAACVEYEDEDNDDVIMCGNTKDFQTDN
jgi:hypothetical protein